MAAPDRSLAAILLFFSFTFLRAQTAPEVYLVQFTDKSNTPYSIAQPEDYLSQRAIDRRYRQNIPIDTLDLPVDPAYVSQLLAAGDLQVLYASRWFNSVTIRSTDTLALDTIGQLPFVLELRATGGEKRTHAVPDKFGRSEKSEIGNFYQGIYGGAYRQISIMNGHLLHDLGARGEGMLIGVLDSGFEKADSLPAFEKLRNEGRILLTRDVPMANDDVYDDHWHGTSVLSTITGDLPGELLGTSPQAGFVLIRTEVESSEFIWEEDNWVRGAELCDSIGCDVLNTSLGYTTFEDSLQDHTYADMNGMTTRISIAANIASKKGMIPVNSAGNSGSSEWYHIGAPADASDILTVGAVDLDRSFASFSSHGPSADGRVKPDVAGVGLGSFGIIPWGWGLGTVNGTSFSSPIVAGSVACLWQLHPERSNHEIMEAVRQSASQHHMPDNEQGYGIPDFYRAHRSLGGAPLEGFHQSTLIDVFPTVFHDHFIIETFVESPRTLEVELFEITGKVVYRSSVSLDAGTYNRTRVSSPEFNELVPAIYLLRATMGDLVMHRSLIKE